jgi:hypothetical protein
MPFSESLRNWHIRAQQFCQTLIYGEEEGYKPCGSTQRLEVDHLTPESELIEHGLDPNNTDAIVRCQKHHTGDGIIHDDSGELRLASYGEDGWSRHPDMGQARQDYRNGDTGAFKSAAKKHHEAVLRGERITNDDWGVTEHERERVRRIESKYRQEHPEDKKPVPKRKMPQKKVLFMYDGDGNIIGEE